MSARKIAANDYNLIEASLKDGLAKLIRSKRKVFYEHLDLAVAMRNLYGFDHAYIVYDSYLVVYDVYQPWYTDKLILQEIMVRRLAISGDFQVVPAFLEGKAREAGCTLVVAGTALAKSNAALASIYQRFGYSTEAHSLMKVL